jgi:hypothetical protein
MTESSFSEFQSILEMHKVATKYEDPQMTDFLEGDFLKEQVFKKTWKISQL